MDDAARTEAASLAAKLRTTSPTDPGLPAVLARAAELLEAAARPDGPSVSFAVTQVAELRARHDEVVGEFRRLVAEMRALGRGR